MASVILRPNADQSSKQEWTEVPSGAGWSCVDDAYTSPDTPDTSDYWTDSSTGIKYERVDLETTSLSGKTLVALKLWIYASAASNEGIILKFLSGAGAAFGSETAHNGPYTEQWKSHTHNAIGSVNQAALDAILMQVDHYPAAGGAVSVYCVYAEVIFADVSLLVPARPLRGLVR